MALMHHNELRVNAPAPESGEVLDIWREQGWRAGPHKDTDPDDDTAVPRVLPAVEPEPEPDDTEDDHAPTKADLLEQAKDLDIQGRSAMSKNRLAAAIAEATQQPRE
jgi:hypothetical protein